MTDEQIIKALWYCKRNCYYTQCNSDCPLRDYRESEEESEMDICGLALDLINRQKSEIEELKGNLKFVRGTIERARRHIETLDEKIDKCRVEAIKVFAERLQYRLRLDDDCEYDCDECCYACKDYVPFIKNLVAEMTERNENDG